MDSIVTAAARAGATLLVVQSGSPPAVAAVEDCVAHCRTAGATIVISGATDGSWPAAETADAVLFVAADDTLESVTALSAALTCCKLGSPFVAVVPGGTNPKVVSSVTLAGFSDAKPQEANGVYAVVAHRPSFKAGAAAPVKLRKKAATPPSDAAPVSVQFTMVAPQVDKGWSALSAEADLIDEDALLDDARAAVPATAPAPSGAAACAPKKRACANCSCGRKEQEERATSAPVVLAAEEPAAPPTSSCGNCWKGDAFRCASCPMLGKPAFAPPSSGAVMLDAGGLSDF